ncbi:hypothetical protein GCM10023085_08530 [Actinomadura viridis]|uniref:Uncharacterized protein n=1 Tax=Actinomadura viridis TaxID=58110 RepID=A0A931GTC8_9ACTN|nr:hypothetical protein [Actinomadura viridis]MBG6091864.1 hypothetical protein [Actinomadura viridis]
MSMPLETMLALGGVSAPAWGWGLLRTTRGALAEMAGLVPHAEECLPGGEGVYWADLAVHDHETGRVWTGTKTFLPARVDVVQIRTDVTAALMADAQFLPGIPGAWRGVVAGVPGHGYLDPNGVGRLPVQPAAVPGVAEHFRAFFPVPSGPAVPPEAVVALAGRLARGLSGRPYVLAAFLLHDVQGHRHHLDVVRAAGPGWEHSGNACHLVRGDRAVRLEHLWLDGRSCELPVADFHAVLDAYEALLGREG